MAWIRSLGEEGITESIARDSSTPEVNSGERAAKTSRRASAPRSRASTTRLAECRLVLANSEAS